MAKPIELCTTEADPMARVLKQLNGPSALADALTEKLGIRITPQRVNGWRNEELRPDRAQSIKTMRDDLARFHVQKDVAE